MRTSKARVDIGGQPILSWLLHRIQWQGPTLLVTAPAREHPPGADGFDREVADPVPGLGPLRGVLTALENSTTPVVAVATVDMPGIRSSHLEWVTQKLLLDPNAQGMLLARTSGPSRAIEPFPSAYRTSATQILARQLADQRRAVHQLLKIDGFHAIDAPPEWPPESWMNVNTPEDLDEFRRSLDRGNA